MNYFAHGYRFLDDPYFLAGTAVPDWLSVVDRKVRVRPKDAEAHIAHDDVLLARVARGVAQHHADDAAFHSSAAFVDLSLRFTVEIRDLLGGDAGMRPSFLGHILVELLLDSTLIEDRPTSLDDYYRALGDVEGYIVEEAVNRMQARRTETLSFLISLFTRERFLCDYPDDIQLLRRLNQVMKRVGLERLPEQFRDLLPQARREVRARRDELLQGV
ncbi:MAG: hypothetical protein JNL96_14960 [Planctomycetaceae bacterium]|nr:hypothetical protein [Planctomycetaceae bacterium]